MVAVKILTDKYEENDRNVQEIKERLMIVIMMIMIIRTTAIYLVYNKKKPLL